MEALEKILPEQPLVFSDNLAFASGCGCTGNCGQSCSGDCLAGCKAIAEEVVQVAVVKILSPCCMVVYGNQLYSREFLL